MILNQNFINLEEFKMLQKNITDVYFPWYLQKGVNNNDDGYFQFTHNFIDIKKNQISDFISILKPIFDILNSKKIIRVKANLLTKTEKIIEHGFHTDVKDCTTAIYYINTNNGYTKFKDGEIVSSEENKFIEFNSNIEHSGSSCTDKDYRIVLNLNYYK
jgi:hypothetical protein